MKQPVTLTESPILMNLVSGALSGNGVGTSIKKLSQIAALFRDQNTVAAMDPDTLVYRVQYWLPVGEGTSGGLFWGTTTILPGKVGGEYFFTHGHFHAMRDRAEFYFTVGGEGALILMDDKSQTRYEAMRPGTLHYIPGNTAHRVANTGNSELVFVGCWPSDAGHDYAAIRAGGFSARLQEVDGKPVLIPERANETPRI